MIDVKPRGRIAVWGKDTTVQPDALELGTANTAAEVSDLKNEWKSVYPNMKYQLVMPGSPGPSDAKWM